MKVQRDELIPPSLRGEKKVSYYHNRSQKIPLITEYCCLKVISGT